MSNINITNIFFPSFNKFLINLPINLDSKWFFFFANHFLINFFKINLQFNLLFFKRFFFYLFSPKKFNFKFKLKSQKLINTFFFKKKKNFSNLSIFNNKIIPHFFFNNFNNLHQKKSFFLIGSVFTPFFWNTNNYQLTNFNQIFFSKNLNSIKKLKTIKLTIKKWKKKPLRKHNNTVNPSKHVNNLNKKYLSKTTINDFLYIKTLPPFRTLTSFKIKTFMLKFFFKLKFLNKYEKLKPYSFLFNKNLISNPKKKNYFNHIFTRIIRTSFFFNSFFFFLKKKKKTYSKNFINFKKILFKNNFFLTKNNTVASNFFINNFFLPSISFKRKSFEIPSTFQYFKNFSKNPNYRKIKKITPFFFLTSIKNKQIKIFFFKKKIFFTKNLTSLKKLMKKKNLHIIKNVNKINKINKINKNNKNNKINKINKINNIFFFFKKTYLIDFFFKNKKKNLLNNFLISQKKKKKLFFINFKMITTNNLQKQKLIKKLQYNFNKNFNLLILKKTFKIKNFPLLPFFFKEKIFNKIKFYSQINFFFKFSFSGFLHLFNNYLTTPNAVFTTNNNLFSLKKTLYSFSFKNELQKFIWQKHLKNDFLFFSNNFKNLTKTITPKTPFFFFEKKLSLDTLSNLGSLILQKIPFPTSFYKSISFLKLYLYSSNNNLNPNEINIKKIKFKPGYQRIWREAREVFKMTYGLKFHYQKPLTNYLLKFTKLQKIKTFLTLETQLNNILFKSKIFPDIIIVNNVINNNLIFVNGILINNPQNQLSVNDFIQLMISFSYYIYYKWTLNANLNKKNRLKNKIKKKNTTNYLNKQKNFFSFPTWIFQHTNFEEDTPKFLEIDYFSLSIFFIYEPISWSEISTFNLLKNKFNIINLYNWKYIN